MSRIERLTPAQTEQLAVYRDRWLGIGLATSGEPLDRIAIRSAIGEAYAAVGLPPPALIVELSSPLRGAVGSALLAQVGAQVRDQVWAQVGAQVRDQVWAQVGAQVRDQVGDQVGAQVLAQVWAQVRAQVWAQVGAQVRDQVGAQVRDQVWAQVGAQVRDQVWAQVGAQVRDQVRDQVWAQVGAQVRDQVGDQVRDQVWAQVGAQVRDQVGDQVRDQVWAQVGAQVRDQVCRACYGSHDAGWLGWAAYYADAVGIAEARRLRPAGELAALCGWWWPFAGAAIVTPRPVALHRNAEHRLHRDGGLAIEYPDGWGVYALNGVRVSQHIACTPSRDLDPGLILTEQNAEIRREIVRKIGIDAVVAKLGAQSVDRQGDYELLLLDLRDGRRRPYLKMLNPSIGTWHVEGVDPSCSTVAAALAWRNGTSEVPAVLT